MLIIYLIKIILKLKDGLILRKKVFSTKEMYILNVYLSIQSNFCFISYEFKLNKLNFVWKREKKYIKAGEFYIFRYCWYFSYYGQN